MTSQLTPLEQRAVDATRLAAFPVNLDDIRRNVELLLNEVGRYGFFDEYTSHSFSHVEGMLSLMEWLIPEETKTGLTPAECFLLVICAYFHDLGLIVTRQEFEQRDRDAVDRFAKDFLYRGESGEDYKSKVADLTEPQRERLLYQEMVRHNHGTRVKLWLEGKFRTQFGGSGKVVSEIENLVSKLSPTLKRDIGRLCESHNLDDLDDTEKYRVSQPFGNSADEEANLQYIGLILRTADLLDISNKRAPSILLRVIDPTDPVSQVEWHKQNAVTRVRRKVMSDQENRRDDTLVSDTVEVFAHFSHAEGFFGLTSYLRYAESQLERSFRIAEETRKRLDARYLFPWRKIDERNVEAEGFIPKQFGFELDQAKILTLLTGHTLYNDSTVVIRELVQNAVDAVRLQWKDDSSEVNGRISIVWRTGSGELEVTDNGTGMSQDTVERHLLKVGSSKYQDPRFKEVHPTFNPISRFGIGVLTAFMVADAVEILTVSPEEDQARQISLRSVHGKYLIRLLDDENEQVKRIGPHGTSIRLRLRPSAKRADVLSTVQKWIVFPRCVVTVQIDEEPPVQVGYDSPRQALDNYLKGPEGKSIIGNKEHRVIQKGNDTVTIAFAVVKNDFYKDWSLVNIGDMRARYDVSNIPIGTCVEGIAVDFSTPGFGGPTILSIANATGPSAPRTNVARSALEDTDERSQATALIYRKYFDHVADEINRLAAEPEHSLSWAIGQAPFIAAPLTSLRGHRSNSAQYEEALANTPLFLLETKQERRAASLRELESSGSLWLVDSPVVRSIESLVKEAPTNITARSIIDITHGVDWLPDGDMISGVTYSGLATETLDRAFEVVEIRGHEKDRRIDLRLKAKSSEMIWISDDIIHRGLLETEARSSHSTSDYFRERSRNRPGSGSFVRFPRRDIEVSGLEGYGGVEALRGYFALPGPGIPALIRTVAPENDFNSYLTLAICSYIWTVFKNRTEADSQSVSASIDKLIAQLQDDIPGGGVDWAAIRDAALITNFHFFDPLAWSKRTSPGGGGSYDY